jgi:hypothetical protein
MRSGARVDQLDGSIGFLEWSEHQVSFAVQRDGVRIRAMQ